MVYTSITTSYVAANTRVAFQRKLGSQPSIFQGSTVQPMVQIAKQMRKSWVCDPSPLITTIPVYPDLMHLFISSLLQFPLQNRGCWHPKNLRFWRAILHPYFATKSKTMGWQAPKNNPFWTFLDCILVGP